MRKTFFRIISFFVVLSMMMSFYTPVLAKSDTSTSDSNNKVTNIASIAPPNDCSSLNIFVQLPVSEAQSMKAVFCEHGTPGLGDLWLLNSSTVAHLVRVIPDPGINNFPSKALITWGPNYWFELGTNIQMHPGESIAITATRFGINSNENATMAHIHMQLVYGVIKYNLTPDPSLTNAENDYRYAESLFTSVGGNQLADIFIPCNTALKDWEKLPDCFQGILGSAEAKSTIAYGLTLLGIPTMPEEVDEIFRVIGLTKSLIERISYFFDYLYEISQTDQDALIIVRYLTTTGVEYPSTCVYCQDNMTFISDVNYPDGSVVSPNQAIIKTWRVKNSGDSIWGTGYQLVFRHGDQMGAPSTIDIPITNPTQEIELSVPIVAPNSSGDHAGYWQLRNPKGTYFGPEIFIKISVQSGKIPGSNAIELVSANFPSVVSPGQSFRPQITIHVNQGQLLEARGDLLRNTDGNLFGAWPHIAVAGTVNSGQDYTFTFYEGNPITAPAAEGTYDSYWQIWQDGNWSGPVIDIHFTVRNGGGTAPGSPILSSPANWSTFVLGNTPTLCINSVAGLQYDFQIYESHDNHESGWISSNCWTPSGLGAYGYQWRVMAKDPSTGLTSGWSDTWHFTIDSNQLSMDPIEFSPGSPSSNDEVRVYTCVHGFNGIGLGLELYANTASDGSANGEWMWISPYGTFCYDHSNINSWPNWGTLGFEDGDHLIKAIAFGPDDLTLVQTTVYHLNHRRPNSPNLINPTYGSFIKDHQITFSWEKALRASTYHLQVSTNSDPSISPFIDITLGSGTTQYSYTFTQPYSTIYWRVTATNELGSSSSVSQFSLDWTAPTSSITSFSSTIGYETAFPVTWSGTDNLSSVRWYDIQFRDGNLPNSTWVDWLTHTTQIANTFVGQPGHTYYFQSRAMDVAGNLEDWSMGDGDTQMTIDLNSRPATPWWNAGYSNKRNLIILNNDSSSLPSGYAMHIHFDATTSVTANDLYNESQSAIKGDDFRIILNDTTELPRYIQGFNSNQIDIWFDLTSPIGPNPSSDSTSYQIYYGNATATNPPGNMYSILPIPSCDGNTVGLWTFTEGSGTIINDACARHTGSINNGTWVQGQLNQMSAAFNGSNTTATMPTSPEYDLPSFTIEAYINRGNNGHGAQQLVRREQTDGRGNQFVLGLSEDYLQVEAYCFGFTGTTIIGGGFHANLGGWTHVAMTFDGSTLRTYINGVLDTAKAYTNPTCPSKSAGSGPIIMGNNRANSDYYIGDIQYVRISKIARTSFPYASYENIKALPQISAGAQVVPPVTGSPDLAVQSINSYQNTSGDLIIQANIKNLGTKSTMNGFNTDLYVNHLPTGSGDYQGSLHFWVNDPIPAGDTVSLTTLIDDPLTIGLQSILPGEERNWTLYAQTDSTGSISETDKTNNITATGIDVCIATGDAYEGNDNNYTGAVPFSGNQVHNFDRPGDEDWVKFVAKQGQTYRFTTSNLGAGADTYLYLYDQDGVTLLASNDDYGGTLASQIEWTAPVDGTYYIQAKQWNPLSGGCGTSYTLGLGGGQFNVYLPFVRR